MPIFKGGLFSKRRKLDSFFVNSYGNAQTRGVYTFEIDLDSGEIFFKTHFKTPTDPSYSFSYGRFVCVTYRNRTGLESDGGICSYASTVQTLALASRLSDNGKTYVHACTNGDDKTATTIFGADYYNGEIMVGSIIKKKLVKRVHVYKLEGGSVDEKRQTMAHPTFVTMTPDEQLCVLDLGSDKVLLYNVAEDRSLVLDDKASFDVEPGSGPKQLLFNKDGNIAYIINELSSTIDVYTYKDRKFTRVQTVDTYDKVTYPDEENLAAYGKFTNDGEFFLVANRGHDSLTLFRVLEDGKLEYRDFADTSANPGSLEIFEDRYIVLTCQKAGIIEVYELNREKDGLLFDKEYSYLINEPVCIQRFYDMSVKEQ